MNWLTKKLRHLLAWSKSLSPYFQVLSAVAKEKSTTCEHCLQQDRKIYDKDNDFSHKALTWIYCRNSEKDKLHFHENPHLKCLYLPEELRYFVKSSFRWFIKIHKSMGWSAVPPVFKGNNNNRLFFPWRSHIDHKPLFIRINNQIKALNLFHS